MYYYYSFPATPDSDVLFHLIFIPVPQISYWSSGCHGPAVPDVSNTSCLLGGLNSLLSVCGQYVVVHGGRCLCLGEQTWAVSVVGRLLTSSIRVDCSLAESWNSGKLRTQSRSRKARLGPLFHCALSSSLLPLCVLSVRWGRSVQLWGGKGHSWVRPMLSLTVAYFMGLRCKDMNF